MDKKTAAPTTGSLEDLRNILYRFQLGMSAVKVAHSAFGSEIPVDDGVIEQALQVAIKGLDQVYDDFDRALVQAGRAHG